MGKDTNRGAKAKGRPSPWGPGRKKDGAGEFAEIVSVGQTLDRIIRQGDAIMFGKTSDGGAISITLFMGEERHKVYAAGQDELDSAMLELAEAYPDVIE